MDTQEPIIGIDLGTTNSVVAILEGEQPRVVPNAEGANRTPSVVAFMDDGRVVVGDIARRQAATNPHSTIASVKRLMGRYYSELAEEGFDKRFRLESDDADRVLIDVNGTGYTPQQISALVLDKLKTSAEEYLGQSVTKAVLTVPAYFDDLQRTATLEAASMAGLEVLRLINEPTAAAMAYGLGQEKDETVAVYDFGGGTFDISILEIDEKTFEVINCAGDTHLGGDDFDQILAQELLSQFEAANGFALDLDAVGYRRLLDAVEKAKCDLSSLRQTQVSLPFIAMKDSQPLHLEATIAREQFEALIEDAVQRTIDICDKALKEARKDISDIKKVILVGGTTRIPLIQEMVEDFFGIQPFKGVNPDEIVALGAATQGGVLSGALAEVVLLDVTPHSLGVEIKDGRSSVIIEKNSTLPIKAAKTFTTTEPNQNFVNIHILQGEHEEASENRSLGKFILSDIAPAPAGQPRIRVTFFINSDGVVEISATDVGSGAEQSLTIAHSFLDTDERSRRSRERKRKSRRSRRAGPTEETLVTGVKLGTGSSASAPAGNGDSKTRDQQNFDMVNETMADEEPGKPRAGMAVRLGGGAEKMPALAAHTAKQPAADPANTEVEISRKAEDTESETLAARSASREESTLSAWSPEMTEASKMLIKQPIDDDARSQLLQAIPLFQTRLEQSPSDTEARLCLARLYLACNQAEECRETVAPMGDSRHRTRALDLLGDLVKRFPNYLQARRDKADLAMRMGRLAEAIEDLETLQEQDPSQIDVTRKLAEAYRTRLEDTPDSTSQFKLVKVYLRLQKLDDGIELLRRLIKNPAYRDKALRVLGLCYWQKNMHELAWQTLRELPLDGDLKDILYRLANDMESLDQLASAREIFSHILSDGEDYRDAAARQRKVDFRLRLRHDQMQQTMAVSDDRVDLSDSRFALIEEINRGSMGIVFKARDKILDEIVALKILNDMLTADPMSVERFKQEARAAKRLSHPNIVRIHDFFEAGNKKFLSMEYIEGEDVKKILAQKGRFNEEELRELIAEVLRALDYAHRLGVVHRDIKPANIMLSRNKEIKVTDFGIAKILSSDDMTRGNAMIVGTPLYMSPEQVEGGSIDARSDIYSLGVTCYELVCGLPPFHEGNIEYHHIHTPAPPLPSSVAEPMREFIMTCIEKSPNERYQTSRQALEFIEAMD